MRIDTSCRILSMNDQIPKWCIDGNSPFLGSDEFRRTDGQGWWEYLNSAGIAYKKDDFPFLTNHKIPRVKKIFDFGEFLHLSGKGEALAYLYRGLGKVWNYVGPILDRELTHGFNDHTDRHTLWVTGTAVDLLQRAGRSYKNAGGWYASTSEVLVTLVGMTHDLGNLIDRKEHSMYSAWLLTRLFGNTEPHQEEWNAVLYTILFHEEPMLADLHANLSKGIPLQWALVAADKMHVGRDRIGDRSYESGIKNNALEDDVHILINALIVRSSWVMAVSSYVWHLDFGIEQLEEKFSSFTRGNGRIWVPKTFYDKYKNGQSYRDIFAEIFMNVYEPRIRMAAMSIFLLFPYINKFQVFLSDGRRNATDVESGGKLICEVVR